MCVLVPSLLKKETRKLTVFVSSCWGQLYTYCSVPRASNASCIHFSGRSPGQLHPSSRNSTVPAVILGVHLQNSSESDSCDLALCIQKPTGPISPACHRYHSSKREAEEFYPPYLLGESCFDLVFILCGP